MKHRHPSISVLALCLGALVAPQVQAALVLPELDRSQLEQADHRRVTLGRVAHFATARPVDIDPWRHGEWSLDGQAPSVGRSAPGTMVRWTLELIAEGATSISLHFDRFKLPAGAELVLRGGGVTTRPLTRDDAVIGESAVPELWTPPLLGSRVEVEMRVPIARLDAFELHLHRVYHGYAGFGVAETSAAESAATSCRVDAACAEPGLDPVAEGLAQLASSVALLVIDGVRFCTGFLIADAVHSGRPLLVTAAHCGLDGRSSASVVVLWNYRRDTCAGPEVPAPSKHFQTGASLLMSHTQRDLALLELRQRPEPSWGVAWAGWDRSDDPLGGALTFHHPDASPQGLARAADAVRSRHFANEDDPAGDHLRVSAWQRGTTEGGSSGAPLFDAEGRVRGWLRGGHAACDNRLPDWFGRLADAWDDPRGEGYRLRDWLDPTGSEMIAVDPLVPMPAK